MIASEGEGGGDIRGSQEAPVAALPPLSNLAPRHAGEEGEKRLGWGQSFKLKVHLERGAGNLSCNLSTF